MLPVLHRPFSALFHTLWHCNRSMDPTKTLSPRPEITHFLRAGGEICLSPWHADCFPGALGYIYWAAESPKGCLAWGDPLPAHLHLISEAAWAGVHSQRVSRILPASLLYLFFPRGVRVHLPATTRTNKATWHRNQATESVEASLISSRSGTQHGRVCSQTSPSQRGCAGGGPWSLCNGKNANHFSGETLRIF